MKPSRFVFPILLASSFPLYAQTDVIKDNNTTNLNVAGSWVGPNVPTAVDTAVFDDTFAATANLGVGGAVLTYLGIRVEGSLTTLVQINNTNTEAWVIPLAGGIDMSAATRDFKCVNLNVGANQAWDVAAGRTLTVGGTRFLGTGDVDLTGDGTVTIDDNGAGVYSGTITVSGGTLDLNDLDGGNVVVNDGGTLDSEIVLPANLTLGSSTGGTLRMNPNTSAAIDAIDLTLTGTNIVELSNLPGLAGTVDVITYSGTLIGDETNFALDPVTASLFSTPPVFGKTATAITLTFAAGASQTWTGATNDEWDINLTENWDDGAPAKFSLLDSVTFDETASEFYVYATEDIAVGSMTFNNPTTAYSIDGDTDTLMTVGSGISAAGDVTFFNKLVLGGAQTFSAAANTTLKFAGTINALSNEITVDGDGTVEINDGGSDNQIFNGAGIVKNGDGLLLMSGRNTSSGNVTVNAGTVRFTNNNWSSPNFGGRLIINAGATAEANTQTFGFYGRSFDITDGTLTFIGNAVYSSSATHSLDGATIDSTGTATLNSRGTFLITGDTPSTATLPKWQVYGNTTWNVEDVTVDDSTDFTLDITTATGIYDSGNKTLVKNGAGTMVLNGITKLDGATTVFNVDAGTMVLNATADAVDIAPWNIADGAGISGEGSIGGALTLGATTGANLGIDVSTAETLNVGGDLTLAGTSTVTLNGTPYTSGPLAVISYGGALTGTPATALTLDAGSAANYRIGNFSNVGNTIVLDLGSKALIWDQGTWDLGNDMNWNSGIDQFYWGDGVTFDDTATSGSVTIDDSLGAINPSSISVSNSSVAYTFSGDPISGAASLTKNGTSSLTLSNNSNSYSGGTTISGGTLAITVADLLPVGGDLTVDSPGTFDMAGFEQTIGALSGDGSVTTGGAALTLESGSFSGVISEAGSLVKTGTGTAILSGTNSYIGTTTISAGTLQIGDGGTTGSIGSGALTNDGILAYALSSDVTVSNLSGAGGLEQVGPGTMFLSDNTNSYSGGTTVTGGILQVGNGGTAGTLPVGTLLNNGTLVFDRSDDISFDGLTGGGAIIQQGTGTLTVNGAIDQNTTSSYPTWFFNAGTVSVSSRTELHNDGIATPATVFTFDGGTLRFDGWVGGETFGGYKLVSLDTGGGTLSPDAGLTVTGDSIISGVGSLTKAGDGTMVLSATNTYTGDTTVTAGILSLTQSSLDDVAALSIETGAVLDLNHLGTDEVGALSLGGIAQADGTYGATGSGASNENDTYFTGTGIIQVGTANDYESWAVDNGYWTPGDANTGPAEDYDNDGVSNEEEYAFGLDPTDPASVNPITVPFDPATGTFSYTRRDPALTSWTYDIMTSTTLDAWLVDLTATQSVSGTVDEVQTVDVTLTGGAPTDPKLFIRVAGSPPAP